MGLGEEIIGVNAMVADHAENGGTVAAPVVHAHLAGGGVIRAEHARHVGRHQPVDLRKDRVRGVVEGVIEVEQPDRLLLGRRWRHHLAWPGVRAARPSHPGVSH